MENSEKKVISLDVDEVIADIMPKFLTAYSDRFGRQPSEQEMIDKKVYDLEGAMEIRDLLYEPGFFLDLPLMEGAKDGVNWLNEHYDIYFVTAAQEFRHSLLDKYDWLQHHFPQISFRKYIFCGNKKLIQADYMLDDHVRNLVNFPGKKVLYSAYHNYTETRFTRVNNWQEVMDYFKSELVSAH